MEWVGRNVSLLCMVRDYQGRTLMVMSNVGNESYKTPGPYGVSNRCDVTQTGEIEDARSW